MTLSDAVFLAVGVFVNGFTFAVGVATGVSLVQRKQENDNSDSNADEDEKGPRFIPLDIGAPHSPQLRSGCGADSHAETDPAKRQDR